MTTEGLGAIDVRAFGAVPDGRTVNTAALQAAIDARAALGGGTVTIPSGEWVTGAIELRDRITLELDAGARLLGSQDPADYPRLWARWEGVHRDTHAPLIGGRGVADVAIVGRGTIDGRGEPWWQRKRDGTLDLPRPRLISFEDATNLLIRDVTLRNSPSWTVNPVRCRNVTVDAVTIVNPPDSPNTDGINPDSCRFVRIANCYIDVGDDCITIKSGIEDEAPELRAPCENIAVTNCTMVRGHGGVVIGSEMSGGVRNVVVSNCVFTETERGIRIKTRRGRGGVVEDVLVTNVVMRDVGCPFTVNLYYHFLRKGDPVVADKAARPVDDGTPAVRRLRYSQIQADDARYAAALVWGLPERPVEDVAFRDVQVSLAAEARPGRADDLDGFPPVARRGAIFRNVRGLRLDGFDVRGQDGDAISMENVD